MNGGRAAFEVVAYAMAGELYCPEHAQPIGADDEGEGRVSPVFLDSEGWHDHACSTCLAEALEAGEAPETLGEANGFESGGDDERHDDDGDDDGNHDGKGD